MTVKTEKETEEKKESVEEKKKPIWSSEERESCKKEYGCELIIENGSYQDVCTKKAPTDSFIVKYMYENKICFDLTRGTRSGVFDMYYDKFKDAIKSIDYGHGNVKPNVWGYIPSTKKKKRK